jgi:hypothetical protein
MNNNDKAALLKMAELWESKLTRLSGRRGFRPSDAIRADDLRDVYGVFFRAGTAPRAEY